MALVINVMAPAFRYQSLEVQGTRAIARELLGKEPEYGNTTPIGCMKFCCLRRGRFLSCPRFSLIESGVVTTVLSELR
jgi:hypothetical protein